MIAYFDYLKWKTGRMEKRYTPRLVMGNRSIRLLHRWYRRAAEAESYGRRVAGRYNRLFAVQIFPEAQNS